jgi:hypothetical protein
MGAIGFRQGSLFLLSISLLFAGIAGYTGYVSTGDALLGTGILGAAVASVAILKHWRVEHNSSG